MEILMLGASGRTGRLIAERLVGAGNDVHVVGRRAQDVPGLRFTRGDVTQAETLRRAIGGAEVVVSALASSNSDPVCSRAAEAVIAAAEGRPLRYLSIGGAGIDAEGDAKGFADRAIGVLMKLVVGRMLADRQREHALLRGSGLAWTMLRPPRLTDGAGTGRWHMTFDRPAGTQIARADLAAAAVEMLGREGTIRRAPFVAAAKERD